MRKHPDSHFEQGREIEVGANPFCHSDCEWVGVGLVVGRQNLLLAFRAREVVVVGVNPLHHSNCEWEGVRWQGRPLSRISSEGGGGGGHESPPSLKLRVGGGG